MNKIIIFSLFVFSSAFAQTPRDYSQLKFINGLQVSETGEIKVDKKLWNVDKSKKDQHMVLSSRKKRETNTWEDGPINIKRHKNKIEIKYKDIKDSNSEIEYIFQGIREEKNDIASLTNFDNKKVSNFTSCVSNKCLALSRNFCEKLSVNIGSQSKADATDQANHCLRFSKSMAAFGRENLMINDLKKIHEENLVSIDQKISEYFNEKSNLSASKEYELNHMVELGDKNRDYFELLIQALDSCEKNFP